MKLIYGIMKIAHLPNGQIIERTVEEIDSTELEKEEINKKKQEINKKYDQMVAKMASLYFPLSPYEYQPNRGIGYAMNLYVTLQLGRGKTYVLRTTYRSSKKFLQAMKQNEEELLLELGNPQYPVNRFYFDGNSDISYCDWDDDLLYHYDIIFLTQYDSHSFISETLYTIGHRCLKEARKIALSLFNKEVEKKKILDNTEAFNPNKGPTFILALHLLKSWEYILTAESKPPLPCLA